MPVMTVGDIDLYFEVIGAGAEAVAFINGIAMSVASWQPIPRRFVAHGYRCLLHDCRGQLRSEKPADGRYSMEQHAADFIGLLDALCLDRVHVVGTSYGSEIGMLVASSHPERVETLTVIAGISEPDDLIRAAAESWASAAKCGGAPFFRCMLPWAYCNDYLAQNRRLIVEQEQATARLPPDFFVAFGGLVKAFLKLDLSAALSRIVCPTFVIAAERDLIKGPQYGRVIHENIADSEFTVINGAGHAVVLERPDLIAEQTLEFIGRHGAARNNPSS